MKVDKSKWKFVEFEKIGNFFSGYTPKSNEISNNESVPYFKVAEMNLPGNERWLKNTPLFVDDTHKVFPPNSIVFPKNGAAVSTNKKRILSDYSVVDLNTAGVTPNETCIPLFAYYWILTKDFNDFIRRGAVPTLNLKSLKKEKFLLPDFDVQNSIVAELEALQEVIDGYREQIIDLGLLASSLFHSFFNDKNAKDNDWSYVTVSNLTIKTKNISWKENSQAYAYIDLSSVDKDTKTLSSTSLINSSNAPSRAKQIVRCGDVIFATTRPTQMRSIIIPDYLDNQICSTGYCVLRPSDKINQFVLYYFLQTDEFKLYLSQKEGGSAYPAVSNNDITEYVIPLPPIELQQQFASQVEAIEKQKELLRQQLADAKMLMAERMQYYFS